MLKRIISGLLFNPQPPNKIRFGLNAGLLVNYTADNRSQHLLGLYEAEIQSHLAKLMRKADLLIDIGANDGYYALTFCKQRNKKVIVCEPGEARFQLIENLKLNNFTKDRDYILVDKLIGRNDTATEMSMSGLLEGNSNVCILMDVDGAELEILRGFDFKKGLRVNWVIETHSFELERSIVELFKQHRYDVQIVKNAWWRKFIPERRPLAHNRWLVATID